MSDPSQERLEQEALNALVAADLSAKMNQWRQTPPPPDNRRRRWLPLLLLALLGGATWWLWPTTAPMVPPAAPAPLPAPAPPDAPAPVPAPPMAQKNTTNRLVALAVSHYQPPNFAADIRGNAPANQQQLNDARKALANGQAAEAEKLLSGSFPPEYAKDATYLRAHAFFAQKKFDRATVAFGTLTGTTRYGEASTWYGLLAQMPHYDNNRRTIDAALNAMAQDEAHTFQEEAKRLLAELTDR
jgi:hypothetical protein